jgi:hypothetical protein
MSAAAPPQAPQFFHGMNGWTSAQASNHHRGSLNSVPSDVRATEQHTAHCYLLSNEAWWLDAGLAAKLCTGIPLCLELPRGKAPGALGAWGLQEPSCSIDSEESPVLFVCTRAQMLLLQL